MNTSTLDRRDGLRTFVTETVMYAGIALCLMMSTSSIVVAVLSAVSHLWVTGCLASAVLFVLGHRRSAGLIGIAAILADRLTASFGLIDDTWAICQIAAFMLMLGEPDRRPSRSAETLGLGAIVAMACATSLFGAQMGWYLAAVGAMLAAPFLPALTVGVGVVFAANAALDVIYSPASFGWVTLHTTMGVVQLIDLPLAVLAVVAFHGDTGWGWSNRPAPAQER